MIINALKDGTDLRHRDPKELPVREKILRSAVILFNRHGVHTTGIDTIIADSGAAKMSFYKHYPSKGKLVLEYLRYKDLFWFAGLKKYTDDISLTPKDRLLGIFDFFKDWFSEPDFRGCPFIKGLSEFDAGYDTEVLECIGSHFSKTQQIVHERLSDLYGETNATSLTPKFMSLIAGATIVAQATGAPEIAGVNKEIAETLLAQYQIN
ncbi:MAG: TetR/AcrR family transcriptional regulator [Rickettsiales bacterium]|nr:TetR/AcrR family transcriptional regulator [Rickettsiales bacterium]